MKLLIYSHYFAPSVGGVETIVTLLARKLCEIQNVPPPEVQLNQIQPNQAQPNKNELDVTVATQTPAAGLDDRSFPFRVVRAPTARQLWRLIRRADIVHVAGPSLLPMFLAKLGRKPYVVEHHGYQAICPNGVLIHQPDREICPGHFQAGHYGACIRCQHQEMSWPKAVVRLLMMFPRHSLSRAANSNIFITRHSLERHRLPRAQVIYYGIEPTTQDSNGVQTTTDSNTGPTRFAYVGRLVPEKGLDILLIAAELLKNEGCIFELLLIGDGSERSRLETIIKTRGLNHLIRITGFLRGTALADQMNQINAVVMPSIWEETAGLAAIEQMMRGRTVIASDIGGLGEVVGNAGLKFPAGDANRLAEQMRGVIQADAQQLSTLGAAASARANSLFHVNRMVAEHVALYRKLS
jgi:glycosyltransferase involved in cell wall biosynthesis